MSLAPEHTLIGARPSSAKLTDEMVTEARNLYREGRSSFDLMRKYDVSYHTLWSALVGTTWKHVPNPVTLKSREKLTDDVVYEARQLYREGWTTGELRRRYNVSKHTMSAALTGERWKHIPNPVTLESREKLTDEAVTEARTLYREGWSQKSLVENYNVGKTTMENALSGKTWKQVQNPAFKRERGRPRKLTDEDVIEARNLYQRGLPTTVLAEKHNVNPDTIRQALVGETFRHIPNPVVLWGPGRPKKTMFELTDEIVIEARKIYQEGWSSTDLAERYDVHLPVMRDALSGESFQHIPNPVILRKQGRPRKTV